MNPKLPHVPKLWYIECKYCQDQRSWGKDHESELRRKAAKLCKFPNDSHFPEFLESYLDRVDHANLAPLRQIEILTAIHAETGCTCLDDLESLINRKTHQESVIDLSVSQPPATHIQHIPQPSRNSQHVPIKINNRTKRDKLLAALKVGPSTTIAKRF